MQLLEIKRWHALGFDWKLFQHPCKTWFYLFRDGFFVKEGGNRTKMLKAGWY